MIMKMRNAAWLNSYWLYPEEAIIEIGLYAWTRQVCK